VINPIQRGGRIRGVGLKLSIAVVVAATLLGAAGSARADNPALTGDVGLNDAFVISLVDSAGSKVSHLAAGSYTVTLHDHSSFHNFHLSGPGVDIFTPVDFVGDQTFTIALTDGTYFYDCDPHSSQMKGSFTVGSVTAPPPPQPTVTKLSASFGGGSKVSLGPLGSLSAGKVVLAVKDRSATDGFRISGPGISRSTGTKFTGSVSWSLTLQPGGTYTFGSARFPKLRKRFTVA
jgi:hypothetical protein